MATLSISPSPHPFDTMASRRVPLGINHNAVNSPSRSPSTHPAHKDKLYQPQQHQKRTFASTQRDEVYGNIPPAKRQMLDGTTRRTPASPTKSRVPVAVQQNGQKRARVQQQSTQEPPPPQPTTQADLKISMEAWREQQRLKMPTCVFYFESVLPEQEKAEYVRELASLGAKEASFFSAKVTHVVTAKNVARHVDEFRKRQAMEAKVAASQEQTPTINPSLLSQRPELLPMSGRDKLLNLSANRISFAPQRDITTPQLPTARSRPDLLVRAYEMGKKMWSTEKLDRVLQAILEPDAYERRHAPASNKAVDQPGLVQMLDKERMTGPADRDPTAVVKDIHVFKGPYIYVYDIEEKRRPIMVREYHKVERPADGDWPQFRSSRNGRSPFTVDQEEIEQVAGDEQSKKRAAVAQHGQGQGQAMSKQTPAETQDGHNGHSKVTNMHPTQKLEAGKSTIPRLQPLDIFKSRMAPRGAVISGEPMASGIQPSGITSAIKSQMISSATGTMGAKAGTHKDIFGLKRQVLQRESQSRDVSSRPGTGYSAEHGSLSRTTSMGNMGSGCTVEALKEDDKRSGLHKRTMSAPPPKPKKRHLKPGYCENCEEKYNDFDEHIVARKHRRFAEDDNNWVSLDRLLAKLERKPKYAEQD